MTEKLFEKNIQIWAMSSPKQAVHLRYLDCSPLSFCKTQKGELNLRRGKFLFHSKSGALEEAKSWFHSLSLRNVSLICVYGVGLGYYYEAAADWLRKNRKRRLVFLEDDLCVIHKLFETELGSKILQNPQVQLFHFSHLGEEEIAFEQLYWNHALSRFSLSALQSYGKEKRETYSQLQHKIPYDMAMRNALLEEYLSCGLSFYLNFYQNILQLPHAYLGTQFFNKFQNVPAIICGAGPSLKKQIPLLHTLKDKALIFAGGSAMNALNSAGLFPHFGVAIDPNPAQLERLQSNKAEKIPFFYRNRVFHKALKAIQGPRLFISGAGGYDTADYFEEKLGIAYGTFLDEGHNVINFCTQIAQKMGCDPLIYVGMDLAYTGMQEYAPGIKEDTAVTETQILNVKAPEESAFLRQDIYGKPTYTLWKWIAEAEWIGTFAAEHPMLSLINCTEGGIGFPGIANKPLKQTALKYLKHKYALKRHIQKEIENSKMEGVTLRKIMHAMRELHKSLRRCENHLQILIEEVREGPQKISAEKEYVQSGRSVLAETELIEEPGYIYILDIFNQLFARLLSDDFQQINKKDTRQSAA